MNQQLAARGQRSPRRRHRSQSFIPREFGPLLDEFALDAHHRIELWTFSLALLMIDEEQVRVVGTHTVADTEWISLQIPGGEQFDIVKPQLSDENEQRLLEGVREIVERERARQRRLDRV